jgi:type II secretory pathway pseudopilin PulG
MAMTLHRAVSVGDTPRRRRGFEVAGATLVEVLVAVVVTAVGVMGAAQLFSLATRTNVSARHTTMASIVAEEKLETLRGFDRRAVLVSSPATALQQNTVDFVDHLDAGGAVVSTAVQPPEQAVYTRRWSVDALPAGGAVLIQVFVTTNLRGSGAGQSGVTRLPGEARIATIAVRRSS